MQSMRFLLEFVSILCRLFERRCGALNRTCAGKKFSSFWTKENWNISKWISIKYSIIHVFFVIFFSLRVVSSFCSRVQLRLESSIDWKIEFSFETMVSSRSPTSTFKNTKNRRRRKSFCKFVNRKQQTFYDRF